MNLTVEHRVVLSGKAHFPVLTTITLSLIAALSSGIASASTGDTMSKGGGVSPSKPRVTEAQCWLDQGLSCFGERTVRPGQPLLIAGNNFSPSAEVVFRRVRSKKVAKRNRARGGIARSEVTAVVKTSSAGESKLEATVPSLERGRYDMHVRNSSGLKSNPKTIKVLAKPNIKPGNTPKIVDAVAKYGRFYSGGTQRQALIFQIASLRPTVPAKVDLVDLASNAVLQQWDIDAVTNRPTNVTWDGRLPNGDTAPEGRYQFRLQVSDNAGNIVTSMGSIAGKESKRKATFSYQKYVFPIQGPYTMGRGLTSSHDGVDVMAKRGTPLVAVTSGKIEYIGSHSRAGIYLILSGFDNRRYFYLHMNEKPVVAKGSLVYAGQRVGSVGITGNASAYHLHFEVREMAGGSGKQSWLGRTLDPKKFLIDIARQR